MLLEDAIALGIRLIVTGEKHPDYKRTVELALKYLILSTGEGIEKLLRRFVKREDEEDFKERCELTKSITPAVCESLEKPWNKVIRNERIKKDLKTSNEANIAKIQSMIDSFYGSNRQNKTNKGLLYWMNTRLFELSFADPNSWLAIEWTNPGPDQVIFPHPFEIPSENALHFSVVNDETKWLFCFQDIKMKTSTKPEARMADGKRFTLYEEEFTIVFEQIDVRWFNMANPLLQANQEMKKIGSQYFIISSFEPKIGYAPVFRIGYKRDRFTSSRTFINPWHKALAFLEKSLKTVSELDLTQTLHSFPQKLQYAYPCPGPSRDEKCRNGLLRDDSVCPACKGIGYKFHTSANDAMILSMPESKDDMLDLEKLIVYKSPPVDLIRWQNDYILQLKGECAEAVFTAVLPTKKSGGSFGAASPGGGSGGAGMATATEVDTNTQGVYDALEPFTEKYSELYREFVTVFAILAGEALKNVTVIHNFPADYKLKTTDILVNDLKTANDSGAPSFLKDAINMDLAENVYSGDELGLLKYRTKRKYFPFNGKSTDEVQYLMGLSVVAKRDKVLYANFEAIFTEIEQENPEFYFIKSVDEQFKIVEAKIQEWLDALAAEAPDLGQLRAGNPLNGEGDNGSGNNGGNQSDNGAAGGQK